MICDSFTPKGL